MNQYNDEIWVFLSHSHDDYEKVLKIRDLLEKDSFRPIMFFLRCLEKDDEVDELIKREIDARKRFILCDSENARKSKWVQREVEYIKSQDRVFETVDLDSSIEEIAESLQRFKRRSTVFIKGYSNGNITSELYKALINEEFRVFNKKEERSIVEDKYNSIRKENGIVNNNSFFSTWFNPILQTLPKSKEDRDEWHKKMEIEEDIRSHENDELAVIEERSNEHLLRSLEDGYVIHMFGKKEFHGKTAKKIEKVYESLEEKENIIIVFVDPIPDNISKHLKDLIKNNPAIEVFNLSIDNAINKIISYIRCMDMKLHNNR